LAMSSYASSYSIISASDPKIWRTEVISPIKRNTVAVVSDGTAVLGLGDIGPAAAMPVMEGKACLFKEFAGVDAFPICLDTKDPEEIVRLARIAAFFREPFRGSALAVPPVPGLAGRLEVFDAGSVRISGTELRDELSRGASPDGRFPVAVAEYITKQGLYSPGVTQR